MASYVLDDNESFRKACKAFILGTPLDDSLVELDPAEMPVYPLRAFCPSLRTLRADDLFFPLTREMIEETAKTHFDQEDQECDYVEDELDDKDFEHVLNVWQRSGLSIESLLTPMKTDLEDFLYWIDDRDTVDAKTAWYAWRTYCSIANTGRGGKSPGLCLACIKKKQYPEGRPSQRRRCRSHCEG